ncbi:MAG: aspartate--tRNA ligase [Treponema sp.]|nr:aspartate--tRNA ligase [Treponema sp.]
MKRTIDCGTLRKADKDRKVILNGWVHRKRDHGGISFINLRDRYGITQVVVDPGSFPGGEVPHELAAICTELRNEFCLAVEGTVRPRPDNMVNPDMPTGEVEVAAEKILILSRSDVLPFQIDDDTEAREELRLKYRYLDLRSSAMQKKMKLRNDTAFAIREYLINLGFYEIETPTFIRSTPEGARDFLVPSRLHPGQFYALPQSPQLYKQILMVSGFDKYFQLARCYRDEDSRGDRQPEHTQIDIEMSFVQRDDVLTLVEGLFGHVFKKVLNHELPKEFRRLTHEEAMENYGTDKPDLRFEMLLQDFSPFAEKSDFQAFKDSLMGGAVKALLVKGKSDFSRKQIEDLEAHAKIYKAKGLAWMKVIAGSDGARSDAALEGGVSKFFASQEKEIIEGLGAKPGDLILIVADKSRKVANISLGAVRSKLGRDLGLYETGPTENPRFEFAWIVDFPLFEFNDDENRWEAAHHMFSYPQTQYHETLEKDPGTVKGDLYDLVLNGFELASGSIRIHEADLQKRIFNIVGFDPAEAEAKFGFLTEAFKYGPPPHGGIAPGLDRLVMLMAGETSIKEVIAFPKNSFGRSLLDNGPNEVSEEQLKELHLNIVDQEKTREK